MLRYSYGEAYMSFIIYCARKENRTVDELVYEFSDNGIEDEFREIYEAEGSLTDSIYYERLVQSRLGQ